MNLKSFSDTNPPSAFDYSSLDSESRLRVQEKTSRLKSLIRRSARDIIEVGKYLIEIKSELSHGNFDKWLEAEFSWSPSTARKFMQVAAKFKSVQCTDLNFATSALYLLARPSVPEKARDEALTRAKQGENISLPSAKEIVARHKANTGENTLVQNVETPVSTGKQEFSLDNLSKLNLASSVLSLLSEIQTPDEARQEVIRRADQDEKITLRLTKEIVARHKASAEQKPTMLDTSTSQTPRATDFKEEEDEQRAEHAIIDVPAVTVPDEPTTKSVSQLFKVGDRIRITRRQHGPDDWTGSTAKVWEVTDDGWLRVNVEGRDGVKFTLHPDWVEAIQETTMTASNQTEVEPVEHQLHVRIPLEIEGKTVQVTGVINEVEVQYTHEGRTGTIRVPVNKVVFPETDKN